MQIVDVLDYGMAKIADLMIKHVMVPAISNSSVVVSVEVLNQEAVEKPEAILNVVPSPESQVNLMQPEDIFFCTFSSLLAAIQLLF